MRNRIKMYGIVVIVVFLSLGLSSLSAAKEGHHKGGEKMMKEMQSSDSTNQSIVDAGNKTCPITGSPINGTDFVVYKNKRYGICCKGCDQEFLKDPEKYIKILKDKGEIK